MTYSPNLVANAFMYKAKAMGAPLTHMKIQKLVFFMHAWSLALTGQSTVSERPEAWPYGPVFDSLYHSLKGNGSSVVGSYVTMLNPETGKLQALIPSLKDDQFWKLLDQVWDRYGNFSATQLSALTHEKGSPWSEARQSLLKQLDDGAVKTFYQAKLANGHG